MNRLMALHQGSVLVPFILGRGCIPISIPYNPANIPIQLVISGLDPIRLMVVNGCWLYKPWRPDFRTKTAGKGSFILPEYGKLLIS